MSHEIQLQGVIVSIMCAPCAPQAINLGGGGAESPWPPLPSPLHNSKFLQLSLWLTRMSVSWERIRELMVLIKPMVLHCAMLIHIHRDKTGDIELTDMSMKFIKYE